jgi:hypothetical protein
MAHVSRKRAWGEGLAGEEAGATSSARREGIWQAEAPQDDAQARRTGLQRRLVRRWAHAVAPLVVVGLALVLLATAYYVRFGFTRQLWGSHGPSAVPVWLAFNDIGRHWALRAGYQAEAIPQSGYDGQFYYYLARDPGVIFACVQPSPQCPIDASPLREERILYPMTARLLTGGDPAALHVALFAINVAAILITVFLVGRLCIAAGASRWLGAAASLFVGEVQGLLRDLADPYAVMWTILAVYLLRKRRPLLTGLSVAAAVLTREQLVLVLPLLGLPWLAQKRWRDAALFFIPALVPFIAWQVVLRVIFGQWGFAGSVASTRGVRWPFLGLWQYRGGPEFVVTAAFVAVPLVAAAALAALWTRRHGIRALLTDPVPLVVLLYAALASLTAYAEWEGTWSSSRLVAPVAVMGVVIAAGLTPRLRWAYGGLLATTALAVFLIVPVLY